MVHSLRRYDGFTQINNLYINQQYGGGPRPPMGPSIWGGCCHPPVSNEPGKGLWTAFGITAGLSFLGNTLAAIFGKKGGGQQVQQQPQQQYTQPYPQLQMQYSFTPMMPGYTPRLQQQPIAPQQNPTKTNLETAAKLYGYTIIETPDGKFMAVAKDKEPITGTFDEIIKGMANGGKKTPENVAQDNLPESDHLPVNDNRQAHDTQLKQDNSPVQDKQPEQEEPPVQLNKDGKATVQATPFSYPELSDGLKWQRNSNEKYANMTTDNLVKELAKNGITVTKEQLEAANPGAIKNGKVVDASKLDIPAKATADNNASVKNGGWKGQEDSAWYSGDQQFVGANGHVYEVVAKDGDHLNTKRFNQPGIRNGSSIEFSDKYKDGGVKEIIDDETGETFPAKRNGNKIVVTVGGKDIPLEEFLSGDYAGKGQNKQAKKVQPDIQPKAVAGGWSGII